MPRDRLSPLDASFLYMDGQVTRNQAVAITTLDGRINFDQLCNEMGAKVGYIDRLRQIPVYSPLNLFHPIWEYDPDFDICRHIHQITLENEYRSVTEIVEEIFATRLPPNHPLWRVYIIDGMPDGRTVHLLQLHHAVTDGIGFATLALAFYDARPTSHLDPNAEQSTAPVPNGMALLGHGVIDAIRGAPRFLTLNARRARSLAALAFSREERKTRDVLRRFRTAPGVRFPFNAPLSGKASYSNNSFTLEDIGAVRTLHGGSINDVVLALVTHAVHRYAESEGIDTEGKYLRLLVPSNVRSEDTRNVLGNFVAMAPVIAPLSKMSVAQRLAQISEFTRDMKQCGLANRISTAISLSQSLLPPPVSRLAHRCYASLWQQRRNHRSKKTPSFNIVVTNVPGSPAPTYIAGQCMMDMGVLVPLLPSIGLVCGAISNNGKLSITFTGDTETVRRIETLSTYVEEALDELAEPIAADMVE